MKPTRQEQIDQALYSIHGSFPDAARLIREEFNAARAVIAAMEQFEAQWVIVDPRDNVMPLTNASNEQGAWDAVPLNGWPSTHWRQIIAEYRREGFRAVRVKIVPTGENI
jgi:hypothetical protein